MAAQRAVKLERMQALLARLGHPQRRFPVVLVAGTKGKGSTVAMLAASLRAAGYRTGRYTSPHLLNWRERTEVDGAPISTGEVLALVDPIREAAQSVSPALGPLTTFEIGTAFAFVHFVRAAVDVAVVEVGTGGRFDATNLADPIASVIAPISYDHTQTLGHTLTSIAWHKAGIMRAYGRAVSAPQPDEARRVIQSEARLLEVSLDTVGTDWTWAADGAYTVVSSPRWALEPLRVEVGLLGDHQRDNATTAVAALRTIADRFDVPRSAIATGLRDVDWPGRLQILSRNPLLVVDGAHNAASANVLKQAIEPFEFERLILVMGLSEGKDALGVLSSLAPRADKVVLTRSRHERSAEPTQLEPIVRSVAPNAQTQVFEDAATALEAALGSTRADDMVLVTGSLFLVGEALDWWRRLHP